MGRTSGNLPGSVALAPGAFARSRSPVRAPGERARAPLLAPPSTKSVGSLEATDGKWPPLLKAAQDGDVATVQDLLSRGADVNCTMPGGGQKTPIYYAIRFEHVEIARLLMDHPDIDVHQTMKGGKSWTTPVEAAKEGGPASPIYRMFQERGLLPSPAGGLPPPKASAATAETLIAPALKVPPAPLAPRPARSSYGGVPLSSRRSVLTAQRAAVYGS